MIKIPRGNRTGPWGQGPRTGRALGYCAGYTTPGYMKGSGMGWGRGYGGGWGRGWGRGRMYYPGPFNPALEVPPIAIPPWTPQFSPEDESKYLEESLNVLKKEIEMIEKRLDELSVKKED